MIDVSISSALSCDINMPYFESPVGEQTQIVIAQPSKINGLRLVFVQFLYFSCQKIMVYVGFRQFLPRQIA
jgi:hypothetical protein